MEIGETVTVVYTDGSGIDVDPIVEVDDTHLVLFDGEIYWHVEKRYVLRNSDGFLRTTSNNVFMKFGGF